MDGNFSAQLHDVVAAGDQPGDDRAVVVPNGLYSTPPGTTTHHLGTHVTGGVDTHADLHVATALDHLGGVLGTAEFRTTAAGYRKLLAWLRGFGPMHQVGVEGTGSYGAGLARHLTEQGVAVIEVARPNRQLRRRHGKSDTLDAVAAARAVLSGEASATPKTHDGPVEALRALKVVQRSANKARTQALNQLHALVLTAPDELRERLRTLKTAELVRTCAAFRIAVEDDSLTAIVRLALRELAQRIGHLGAQLKTVVARLHRITKTTAPELVAIKGVGPDVASTLLVTAGENPHRLRSEASFAALWRIAIVRLSHDQRTRDYLAKRTTDGKNTGEILRCLKRYIAREVFAALPRDLIDTAPQQAAA